MLGVAPNLQRPLPGRALVEWGKPSFLNYGRDAYGISVVPWGTTSLSHPYHHLISFITFRCLFSVLTFFPSYARGLYPVFSFLLRARRLVVSPSHRPNVTVTLSPSPTLSHTPSTRASMNLRHRKMTNE